MKPATIVFLVSQFVVAAVFELLWLSDDSGLIDWRFLHEHSWKLLVWAQVLAMAAGVWEGVAGRAGRRRLIVCAVGPVTLVAWFMLQGFFSPGAPGLWKILVLLPTVVGTSILFAPSWVAVAAGVLVGRAAHKRFPPNNAELVNSEAPVRDPQ